MSENFLKEVFRHLSRTFPNQFLWCDGVSIVSGLRYCQLPSGATKTLPALPIQNRFLYRGHSEPRKRAKNLVAFLKKAKPLKECFKILRQSACAFTRIRMTQKRGCIQRYKLPLPSATKKRNGIPNANLHLRHRFWFMLFPIGATGACVGARA